MSHCNKRYRSEEISPPVTMFAFNFSHYMQLVIFSLRQENHIYTTGAAGTLRKTPSVRRYCWLESFWVKRKKQHLQFNGWWGYQASNFSIWCYFFSSQNFWSSEAVKPKFNSIDGQGKAPLGLIHRNTISILHHHHHQYQHQNHPCDLSIFNGSVSVRLEWCNSGWQWYQLMEPIGVTWLLAEVSKKVWERNWRQRGKDNLHICI